VCTCMKVLYLLPQPKVPHRIGAYTFLDEEVQALAASGIEAYVLSTAIPDDGFSGEVRLLSAVARSSATTRIKAAAFLARYMGSASSHHVSHPQMWFRAARMEHLAASIVDEYQIEVIHSHFAWPQGFGGALARGATGRPLVASLRGTDILMDRAIGYGRRAMPAFDKALRVLLRSADRTVYFSDYMRQQGIELGAPSDRTRLIRKGVDLQQFSVSDDRERVKRELGLPARPLVLTVGGLIPRKGIHHVIEALALLRERRDFTCVVCGEGPELSRLQQLSASAGIADRVVFTGRVDRVTIAKYFAACDVFTLASSLEAAGNVLFEAMASGRPIVCTSGGGPQEYVADGETGYVVPVGDCRALSSRIDQLLGDAALADRLGDAGRRRALREFSYSRMVADLIEVYEDVIRSPVPERMAG
jgi:glycosyltransferase involved in cell wall biosynthesis